MKSPNHGVRRQEPAIEASVDAIARPQQPAQSWKQQLAAAKTAWDRLSVIELLRSGGRERALVDLVEDRYAVSRDEAGRQVQRFMHRQLR